ncbi:MAG: hypothetical protein BWX59_01982 [Bacteroidetes bacterium ADurb.Bin028]|nr:MAG: hypothetical protein BWX59_01982 [Bacteroidetes bacterium ADurb.Bin028]
MFNFIYIYSKNEMLHTLRGFELITYQDKLYYVFRKVNKNSIKDGHINDIKEFWRCDIVLKKRNNEDDMLLFLVEIPDAIIIEDREKTETI